MIYIIVVGLAYWLVCVFRIRKRIDILNMMEHLSDLQVKFEENHSYFVMVDGMQHIEMENYLKLSKKKQYSRMQGIVVKQEKYYNADAYGNNFIVKLDITMLPCIIKCVNANSYIIYDENGANGREVVLNE